MNIMFFLHPKSELAYIYDDQTLRQVMEVMEYYKYSCIPLLDRSGHYIGTLTEGDLLWGLKDREIASLKEAEAISIMEIERRNDYKCVSVESNIEDMIGRAMDQNFVPVTDDNGNFSGIITRKDIIGYCYDKLSNLNK